MPLNRVHVDILRVVCLGVCLLVPVAGAAQSASPQGGAPPVDQAEGGGATGTTAMRIGAATLSGSVWVESATVTDDPDDNAVDTIRVRRARVGLAGALTPRIGWNISGELTSQPALRNAFIVVQLPHDLSLRVGQANPISALERGSSPLQLELIDRSIVTNELTGPADVGISLFTTAPYRGWLGYAVNLFNGAGFSRPDDNDAKDVSGRVALTPPTLRGLMVVISGARGDQPNGLRTRAGVGAEFRRAGWRLMAERLTQTRDELPRSDGYFASAAYRFVPRNVRPHFAGLEIAGRWAVLNDHATAAGAPSGIINDDGGDVSTGAPGIATSRELQVGVNYYATPNIRVMGDVVVPLDERPHPGPSLLMRWQILF
jgi:hypothetical protein